MSHYLLDFDRYDLLRDLEFDFDFSLLLSDRSRDPDRFLSRDRSRDRDRRLLRDPRDR